jgi:hypothetical protein
MKSNSPDSAKWIKILSECLASAEREQIGSRCPVVDHEVLTANAGSPEDICVWLICRSKEEMQLFNDTEHSRFASELRRQMLRAGFPETAVASFRTQVTSREEIEAHGGRITFAR